MSKITIVDLEVFYCVGVTDEERAKPQRLLLTVDMSLDFSSASVSDRIERTINYQTAGRRIAEVRRGAKLEAVGETGRQDRRKDHVEYHPDSVLVEVKKFSIPQARFVSVSTGQTRPTR